MSNEQQIVYALINEDWDGIQEIILFAAMHAAKTEARKRNKKEGHEKYKIKLMPVLTELKGST